MLKYLIVVEGIADIVFFRDYLKSLFSVDFEIKIENKRSKGKKTDAIEAIILNNEKIEIKILQIGSYTGIKPAKTQIEEHIDSEYKILVIQDADNPKKKDGGVRNRIEYLDKIQIELSIKFEIFLFPNHQDDGDLETLLLQIVNNENYQSFYQCYEKYIYCLKKFAQKEFIDEMSADKDKVFNYVRIYYGMNGTKEKNRSYIKKYWDFESKKLLPLEKFLKKQIEI